MLMMRPLPLSRPGDARWQGAMAEAFIGPVTELVLTRPAELKLINVSYQLMAL